MSSLQIVFFLSLEYDILRDVLLASFADFLTCYLPYSMKGSENTPISCMAQNYSLTNVNYCLVT